MHAAPYFYIICRVSQTKLYNLCKNYAKNQNTRKIGDSFRRRRLSCIFRNDQIAVSQKLFAFRAGRTRRRFIIPDDLRVTLQDNFFFVRTVFLHKGAEPAESKIVGRPLIIRNERRCFDTNRLICRPAVEARTSTTSRRRESPLVSTPRNR